MPGICGFGAACADTDAKAEIAHMAHLARSDARGARRDRRARADRQRAGTAHRESLAAGPALAGDHQLPAVGGDLRLGGLRLLEGAPAATCSRPWACLPPCIDGSIRVSFSRDNTEADVSALCQALAHAKQTLKG